MILKDEMENLKQLLLKMSDFVVLNINDSINYYFGKCKVNEINDDLIDQYERLIEEMCINILLRERPYARDLKEVTGVLKLVSDLERIGDHAEDIFSFAKKIETLDEDRIEGIEELSNYVINMLNNSIKAFINKDYKLANEVIDADDYVDKKYLEIIDSLGTKESSDEKYVLFAIYTTLVVKYLERIADHSVNIAEWVVYILSGFYKDKAIL